MYRWLYQSLKDMDVDAGSRLRPIPEKGDWGALEDRNEEENDTCKYGKRHNNV